jgi:hypothetical protein
MGVGLFPSLKRRGGRDINKKFPFRSEAAGVVSPAKALEMLPKHFAELTTPAAPFRWLRIFLLVRIAAEDPEQTIVAFMAGVLIKRNTAGDHRDLRLPGFREHRRVIDREFVEKRIGSGLREALCKTEIFVGSPEFAFVGEIRRFDDECISLPMAARITEPLTDS